MMVITKIIANYLKTVIGKLAGETQISLMPGGQAANNIILVQEVVHSMRRKSGKK